MTVYEIRWHGRGGQGVVTAAQIFAEAAVKEGKYAVAIPHFGAERRGAPVVAYNRVSSTVIRSRASVKNPDAVVVLDPYLPSIVKVTEGLKEKGLIVLNARKVEKQGFKGFRIAVVDATGIALSLGLQLAGLALVNMPMLGALVKASGIVDIQSVVDVVKKRWPGTLGDLNAKGILTAYEKTEVFGP